MIVRRLAARRLVKTGSTEEEPRRRRAARFLLAILVAGLFSGIAAWLDVWPFGSVHALLNDAFSNPPQLPAQTVFPPVQPTHRTVDVYDPAPAGAKTSEPSQPSQPPATGSPRPTPRPTPSGSPPPDE